MYQPIRVRCRSSAKDAGPGGLVRAFWYVEQGWTANHAEVGSATVVDLSQQVCWFAGTLLTTKTQRHSAVDQSDPARNQFSSDVVPT